MDLDNIRKLLDLYYLAETSPEQEATILRFFKETDRAALPSDLKEEAVVFLQMDTLNKMYTDATLVSKIDAEIVRENKRLAMRRLLRRSLQTVAGAAAIVALGVLIGPLISPPAELETVNQRTAEVVTVPVQKDSVDIVPRHEVMDAPKVHPIATKDPKPKETRRKKVRNVPVSRPGDRLAVCLVSTDDANNFVEITDADEAAKVIMQVNSLLDKAMTLNVETQNEINDELNQINEKISSKLSNI